ncbi:MAG: CBS domain-containing protein [Chloroflexota bacterium]|nr:CBS domain-containing protein [Chloroflexota bacterium]
MALTVKEIMTPHPIVVDEATPAAQCARLMDDHDIGALGVMREGRLVGVLTDRDIVIRAVARERDLRTLSAGDMATPTVVAVAADAPVEEAERRMRERAVRRLFIVGDDGRPLGILTTDDLIALREPHSIMAQQLGEWGMVRSDQGYSGSDD